MGISDRPASGGGSSYTKPNVSATEFVADYTYGGEIVYGIVVDFGVLPNTTSKTVAISGYNSAYTYLSMTAFARDTETGNTLHLPYINASGSGNHVQLQILSGDIFVNCAGDRSAYDNCQVTIHYTK